MDLIDEAIGCALTLIVLFLIATMLSLTAGVFWRTFCWAAGY